MARKKTPATPKLIEPPKHHAHIGRDPKGRLCYLGTNADGQAQAGTFSARVAIVDVARPFRYHVPSNGKGKSGLVIEGMAGGEPWSASSLLAGARQGWFGLKLVV